MSEKYSSNVWSEFRENIADAADWVKFAEHVGIELLGNPTPQGWVVCRSVDGDDANPSASFNINSGYYKDFRDGEKAVSPYDLLYEVGKADDFFSAQKYIADMFNVKMPRRGKENPEHGVKWQPWKDSLLRPFLDSKPGITLDGLKRAGAKLCIRHGESCIALPVVSTRKPYDIVGWMFFRRDGYPFELSNSTAKCICKTYENSKGFVTSQSIMHEIFDTSHRDIHWVEGGPDMLAALSQFPNSLVVTNPHGCVESVSSLQRAIVTSGDHDVHLIADADAPGIAGATKRLESLNSKRVKVYIPPYEVEAKHGKDLRDFIVENHPKSILEGLKWLSDITDSELTKKAQEDVERDITESHAESVKKAQAQLESVGCVILGVEPGVGMKLYSMETKGSMDVRSIGFLGYDDMVMFLGFRFSYLVFRNAEEMAAAERGGMLFSQFKTHLALASTDVIYRNSEIVGSGIWAVEDDDRAKTGEILIIKHGESYVYEDKERQLHELEHPIIKRMCAKMSERHDWFDHETLKKNVTNAQSVEWRELVYGELYGIVSQWNWSNEYMAELCCGLIFASWIQALHEWRPMVTVTGESNSGKTVLMKFIEAQFLGLANASARSTAAGVLQSLGVSSQPILLDEFDNGKEQSGLMERFRVASRGQSSLYGTADQAGKSYRINHIIWFSGIYAASSSQADMNRMINLRLLQAKDNKKTLDIPDPAKIRELGHKILASVIVTANKALEMTEALTNTENSDGIQSRYRESLAVPYGSIGAILGMPVDEINYQMTRYLTDVIANDVAVADAPTDQEQLLLDILASEVRLPNDGRAPTDHASVAELLFGPKLGRYRDHARTKGVGYFTPRKGDGGARVLFAGRRMTGKGGLLKGTEWSDRGMGVLQILERVPKSLDPVKQRQQVAGSLATVVSVQWGALKKWCEGDADRREAVGL